MKKKKQETTTVCVVKYLEKLREIDLQTVVGTVPLLVQRRRAQTYGRLVNPESPLQDSVHQVLEGERFGVEVQLQL